MNNSHTNTIIAIQQHYGFKSSKMCELLGGMNRQTFRNNKSKTNPTNNFKSEHVSILIKNIGKLIQTPSFICV